MTTAWDAYWAQGANRTYWTEPDGRVTALVASLDRSRFVDVLDLGCGLGRHALYLARAGFRVTAIDSSAGALAVLRRQLDTEGLCANVLQADYSRDLFQHGSFDIIVAYNVIYHGYRESMAAAIRRVHGWLKDGGLFFFTCPTRRDDRYGNGEQVAPHTYRPLNSIHPGDTHYFTDEADLRALVRPFTMVSTEVDEHHWDNQGKRQFSSYWQVLLRKG